MSKSTPINQLPMQPNNMEQPQEPSNNESELVQEILKEIEDNSGTSQNMPQDFGQQQPQQQQMQPQMQQMQQMQPQMMQPQMQPQMMQPMQEINQEQPIGNMPFDMQGIQDSPNLTTMEVIVNEFKTPGLVSVIVVLLSLPQVNSLITNLLPNKQFIINNSNVLIIVLKSILAGAIFYGLNKTLM